ncbi:MBL fold metallo-hydrolase [Pseudothauera nasutitermitis]|uniref:MBL fold metallo-hydrolase n=1 Tax=Pseudothauera nasutitermitis TaxID=2565930 RepID=A0A4V3WB07_9RHOO|nr:MBL fold metallo-hydrolase [Pseudothauera nasutitermitis]THF61445.1 MBL fold metallo-hydrolase [Pseudothauera nasutitermitis]
MYFRLIEEPRSGALGYLLADPRTLDAVVIDPPAGQDALIRALLAERELRLCYVARTHVHQPDLAGCAALCARSGAVCVSGTMAGVAADVLRVGHGGTLAFGDEVLHVLATPGHTPGCISYRWRDRLFCGDVFDMGGCAAGDGEADPGVLYDTLTQRVFTLPGETLLFPAHRLQGRTVSCVTEERGRYARAFGTSRESFLTAMAIRQPGQTRTAEEGGGDAGEAG